MTLIRRFFFVPLLLLTALAASGKSITPQEAYAKAQRFMQGKILPGRKLVKGKAQEESIRPYYIFNAEKNAGFVIVAGDDRVPEILGYSDKGSFDFDNMPPSAKWLLDSYEKDIASLGNKIMDVPRRAGRASIAPLVKTHWGQGQPYNDLCPMANNARCVTGCVATAMAQVVNYHQWPKGMTSKVDRYVTSTYKKEMPELPATMFDWNNMSAETSAKLMLYCDRR